MLTNKGDLYQLDAKACCKKRFILEGDKFDLVLQSETPSDEDYRLREGVIRRINDTVRGGLLGFRGLHVEHYGSFTSQLFTPTGDLDIAIEGVLQYEENGRHRSVKACPENYPVLSPLINTRLSACETCQCSPGGHKMPYLRIRLNCEHRPFHQL